MSNKTQPTKASVSDFLNQIENDTQKQDCIKLNHFFKKVSSKEPTLWGSVIIGYGDYHYKYKSGREGDWFQLGYSPRKAYTSLYVYHNTPENKKLLEKLGKFKMGKSCINIKYLEDIELSVLKEICLNSIQFLNETYTDE
ncbi:DUF1801 domain-containing protein [Psychroflexus salis]|uniref:YdhG-like domain-containing protein n=1 Tax=Psychroflexus salis TaxID=1526574 RepID=A0A916ZS96_9FLAO|nr:DUF1801 domain-containing protein [Psychroflexus salis]GGE11569.1 hypothetical protein GCM10010831_11240 [Psychroflexus salis]